MVKLENTTSIYEVALATNFVLGYLILKYRDIYSKSTKIILTETVGEEFTEKDNCFILKNGNNFSKKAFQRIRTLFKLTVILSIFAILLSYLFLLFAGLYPDYLISNFFYISTSFIFIIINPMIYFRYKIAILNLQSSIDEKQLNESEMSNFMKNYIPLPFYRESILQKAKCFFYFKTKYIKSKLSKKSLN